MTTYFGDKLKKTEIMDKATEIFAKDKAFNCEISMKKFRKSYNLFAIYINKKECYNYTGEFPFWAINWIKVNGDVDLLEKPFITSPEMDIDETNQIFKHELSHLPFYVSSFCLEGSVLPSSKVEGNAVILEIILMHESNDISPVYGDILLAMKFSFLSFEHGTPTLELQSKLFQEEWTLVEHHNNVIGQSGVNFKVRIFVEEKHFKIQVNDGTEFINYNHTVPPWMVNWIMVKGNVKNVKFEKEAMSCSSFGDKPLSIEAFKGRKLHNY
ncbi:hypothetical protein ACQ4LE_000674 [Meloidogyne hapla]